MNKRCKILSALLFIVMSACVCLLTACNHVHSFEPNKWEKDGTYHWQVCTECKETSQKQVHIWDNGTVVNEPTENEACEVVYSCTVCGQKETLLESHGLEFEILNCENTYSVIGIGTCKDKHIWIPKKYNGKYVTSIYHSAFENIDTIESVHIPVSVTQIYSRAFLGCSGLLNVFIPNSVVDLGTSVFKDCDKLSSVVLSNRIQRIEERTFMYCPLLKDITFNGTIDQWKTLEKHPTWNYENNKSHQYTIHCLDGDITENTVAR